MSCFLCYTAAEVVLWTKCHSVSLTARYIPGKKNVLADQLSCLPGSSHGMVPSSYGLRGDLRGVRLSPSRPLCHPRLCQASSLRLSGSRPDGLEAGCIPAPLGQSVCLCLPTICSAQAGLVESSLLLSTGLSLVLVAPLWPQR